MQDARCGIQDTRFKRTKTQAVYPDFSENKGLAEKITKMAIKIDGWLEHLHFFAPLLIILSDVLIRKERRRRRRPSRWTRNTG